MAMNLTTNGKGPTENMVCTDHTATLAPPQTKDGNIDLSLPITSTYLKRMKALGLTTGYESLYGHHSTIFNVSNLIYCF